MKARTSRVKSSIVTSLEKCRLASPAVDQKLPETALCLPGLEWNSIQQQLVVGNSQQKAAVAGRGQTLLQFIPGDFELGFRSLMFVAVHPGILDQDVQAMDKRSRRCRPIGMECT